MADFSIGHFTTDDQRVAEYLLALGYPEIPLDATEPPNIIIQKPTHSFDGDVLVMTPGTMPESQTIVEPEQPPEVKMAPADRPTAPPPKVEAKEAKTKEHVKNKTGNKSAPKKPALKRVGS
jgi:hypothetical protein